MKGLVNKPQFDTTVFAPGKAVRVESSHYENRNDFYGFRNDCLIVKAEPLQITIAYVKNETSGSHDYEEYSTPVVGLTQKLLPVDLVANGVVTITLMEKAVEATEGGTCKNG